MSREKKSIRQTPWVWWLYFIFYTSITGGGVTMLFSPSSPVFLYYQILVAFDYVYILPFFLNGLAALMGVFSLVQLYAFIRRHFILTKKFWQWFFVIRIVTDATGHMYDFNFLKSIYYTGLQTGLQVSLGLIAIHIPSYIALAEYAFVRKWNKN